MTEDHTQALSRDRLPVLFVGHGSPINAIEDNPWSRGFSALREQVPRPVAILAISAHATLLATLPSSKKIDPILRLR